MIKKYSIKGNHCSKDFYLNLKQINFLEVNYCEGKICAVRISSKGSYKTLMLCAEHNDSCEEKIEINQETIKNIVSDFNEYTEK